MKKKLKIFFYKLLRQRIYRLKNRKFMTYILNSSQIYFSELKRSQNHKSALSEVLNYNFKNKNDIEKINLLIQNEYIQEKNYFYSGNKDSDFFLNSTNRGEFNLFLRKIWEYFNNITPIYFDLTNILIDDYQRINYLDYIKFKTIITTVTNRMYDDYYYLNFNKKPPDDLSSII
ncbi:MAG: hypothetical protein HZB41_06320 [Ignavibacteriae bacterium]|nr:hypothetical protein [Ignavibacteriota bacterium]